MQGKHRWLKPARWSGRLQDLEELAGKCACPSWVVHEILRGKYKTSAAAEYPAALAERYANLVIKVFKQNLQLEFWRYKLQTKEGEVNKLQKNWVKSREARTPPPPSTEGMASSSKKSLAGRGHIQGLDSPARSDVPLFVMSLWSSTNPTLRMPQISFAPGCGCGKAQ